LFRSFGGEEGSLDLGKEGSGYGSVRREKTHVKKKGWLFLRGLKKKGEGTGGT